MIAHQVQEQPSHLKQAIEGCITTLCHIECTEAEFKRIQGRQRKWRQANADCGSASGGGCLVESVDAEAHCDA